MAGAETDVAANGKVEESAVDALSFANTLRSRNKLVTALALYERVLEIDGGNVEALIGRGICLQKQEMDTPAHECFSEAIKLVDPRNACALTHCGNLYKDEGLLLNAVEYYQKALRAESTYKPAADGLAIVLTDLGTVLRLGGHTLEGIQLYCDAITMDPHYAPAYYNLGDVCFELEENDLGLDIYARCLEVCPNFTIAGNNMAIAALPDLSSKVFRSQDYSAILYCLKQLDGK